jgi:hypothetical protein
MKEAFVTAQVSRRTLLATAAFTVIAGTIAPKTASANVAKQTYGRGYNGGY